MEKLPNDGSAGYKKVIDSIGDILNEIEIDKALIVNILSKYGIESTINESLTSLINKLNTINSGGGFTEGIVEDLKSIRGSNASKTINHQLNGVPSQIVVTIDKVYEDGKESGPDAMNYSVSSKYEFQKIRTGGMYEIYFNIENVNENSFDISLTAMTGSSTVNFKGIKWYAYK